MALALPIAEQLDAPQPITAAAVALTGTAGSLVVRLLLDAARFKDPIARGLAAAAAAHGFGTAALSAREPETLPYCALSCEWQKGSAARRLHWLAGWQGLPLAVAGSLMHRSSIGCPSPSLPPTDAMCGVTASLWAALPPIRHLLLAITG